MLQSIILGSGLAHDVLVSMLVYALLLLTEVTYCIFCVCQVADVCQPSGHAHMSFVELVAWEKNGLRSKVINFVHFLEMSQKRKHHHSYARYTFGRCAKCRVRATEANMFPTVTKTGTNAIVRRRLIINKKRTLTGQANVAQTTFHLLNPTAKPVSKSLICFNLF